MIELRKVNKFMAPYVVTKFVFDPIGGSKAIYNNYGSFVQVMPKIIFGVGPQFAREILSNHNVFLGSAIMVKGPENSAFGRLRKVYFAAHGKEYSHYQKQFRPYFKKPVVDNSLDGITRVCQDEISSWPVNKNMDFCPLLTRLATRLAIVTFFKEESNELATTAAFEARKLVRLGGLSLRNLSSKPLPGSTYKQMLAQGDITEKAILAWAETRKDMCPEHDIMASIMHNPDENGCPASGGRIAAYVLNLFGASYETTVSAGSTSFALLAQYPDMAGRIREELKAAGWTKDGDQKIVETLPFLDWFTRETLRMFPPGPMQMRRTGEATTLLGHDIKKNTKIAYSAWQSNRLEEIYNNPNMFDPERWDGASYSPYEWPTFSAGARRCTGMFFGLAYIKLVIANLVASYDFVSESGSRIDLTLRITLKPKKELPLTLVPAGKAPKNPPKIGGNFGEYLGN